MTHRRAVAADGPVHADVEHRRRRHAPARCGTQLRGHVLAQPVQRGGAAAGSAGDARPRRCGATSARGGIALWFSALCWAVMYTNFMLALTLTTVATVLVTMAIAPLVTALFSRAFLQHRLPARTWVAIGAGRLRHRLDVRPPGARWACAGGCFDDRCAGRAGRCRWRPPPTGRCCSTCTSVMPPTRPSRSRRCCRPCCSARCCRPR